MRVGVEMESGEPEGRDDEGMRNEKKKKMKL